MDSSAILEHTFRHEYAKMIAILAQRFGYHTLDLIEDAVQEALYKASSVWSYQDKLPENPTQWLIKVANNHLLDQLKRAKKIEYDDVKVAKYEKGEVSKFLLEKTDIEDKQLLMIFACCHPSLSKEKQLILSLKLLCGFNNKELSLALLKSEEAIAKSFTRAKKTLKEIGIESEVIVGLNSRLEGVLKVIYLIFTQGYKSFTGDKLVQKEMCIEALRLALLLDENEYCNHPKINGLISLMCFQASRIDVRVNQEGHLITLEEQDRTYWDQPLINMGNYYLDKLAGDNAVLTDYHIEAAIAFCHSNALTYKDTPWERILSLYDLLIIRSVTPFIKLNRVVALAYVKGDSEAYKALEEIKALQNSYMYYSIKAFLHKRKNEKHEAIASYDRAIELVTNNVERAFLEKEKAKLT